MDNKERVIHEQRAMKCNENQVVRYANDESKNESVNAECKSERNKDKANKIRGRCKEKTKVRRDGDVRDYAYDAATRSRGVSCTGVSSALTA